MMLYLKRRWHGFWFWYHCAGPNWDMEKAKRHMLALRECYHWNR